jgi:hypothetical protein
VSPDRRRRAVVVLRERFGVSERRACRVVGQHRSAQRRSPAAATDLEGRVRSRLREIAGAKPRWGWRKAYWLLGAEGLLFNHKRVRAYWIAEGLKRPAKTRKRQRVGPRSGDRLSASRPGPSPSRRLANPVQHLQAPRLPRRTHPRRLPPQMDQPTSTLMTAGPQNGVRSLRLHVELDLVAEGQSDIARSRRAR